MFSNWRKLPCLQSQLQLKTTLLGGQSFRWRLQDAEQEVYSGVMANIVWLLKQSEESLHYQIVGELPYPTDDTDAPRKKKVKPNPASENNSSIIVRMKVPEPKPPSKSNDLLYEDEYYEKLLTNYFRLDVDLDDCYAEWMKAHDHFKTSASQFYAVRVLDQDPVENLISFICSQNNHIARISKLVEKVCSNYGQKICDYADSSYFNFPDISALCRPEIEQQLRDASFGYRAKYIQKSSAEIMEKGGLQWFQQLQKMDYKQAHTELLSLTGIGPKVADCICLMSLNHLQAIPVDTHVFQIAQHYLPHLSKAKSVTGKVYTEIGDKFREIYGPKAGWAQTVLFCADLKQFKDAKEKPKTTKKSGKSR